MSSATPPAAGAALFTPMTLGRLSLPNRIVMAPLTRNRATVPGNAANPLNALYYAQRASAGLIISEATPIAPMGHGYPATPGIHSTEQIAGWRLVTQSVHDKGGRIFLQLWHVGRISHPSLLPEGSLPVAPSAIKPAGQAFTYEGLQDFVTPRALELDELPGIVEDYRNAALNALEAGFDGVEIHGANGYLLDQFLRDGSNQRGDGYGGSLQNRCRLLLEVTEAVCGAAGADRVGLRISPVNPFNDMRDSDPQALFEHVAEALSPFGLAYLHVMEGGIGEAPPPFDFAALRRKFRGTYMANSGYDKARANHAITTGLADCVAFGIPYIANPDLVERFRLDAPLNAADPASFYGGDEHGYTDYPPLAGA